jgi:hypothetical protein
MWPSLDAEAPNGRYALRTHQVLRLLPSAWHEDVWCLLFDQLESARKFGRNAPGEPVMEDLAQSGVRTTRWLLDELEDGFPSRASELSALHRGAIKDSEQLWLDELTRWAETISCADAQSGQSARQGSRRTRMAKPFLRFSAALRDERPDMRFPADADVGTYELKALMPRPL